MSYFGFHLQSPIDDWTMYIAAAANNGKPHRVFKGFEVEMSTTVKNLSPTTATVFRHYEAHQGQFLEPSAISPSEADRAADNFILRFKDSVVQHGNVDYVESLNETYAAGNPTNQKMAVAFDRAFIRRLKVHCPKTRPVVYTAASGNIHQTEFYVLYDLARECQAAGGAFGYHNYWSVVNGQSFVNSERHARDYHMRWAYLDEYLVSRGVRVKWMLGESGPIGAHGVGDEIGYWQNPDDGWKHPGTWNGNFDGYLSDLAAMDALFAKTRAAQEGRLIGATLFTTGRSFTGWPYFQIQKPEMGKFTQYLLDSDPTPPPPPPPPPPPDETFQDKAWRLSVEEQIRTGIPLNKDAALQKAIFGGGRIPVHREFHLEGWTFQAGEDLAGVKPRLLYGWKAGVPLIVIEGVEPEPPAPTDPWVFPLSWPVDNQRHSVNHPFDEPRIYDGKPAKHEGVDLYAQLGDLILAAAPGMVVWSSNQRRSGGESKYGEHIIVEHDDGVITWYCHLSKRYKSYGEAVERGEPIGEAGSTGNSSGVHLHFNVQHLDHGAPWPEYVVNDVIDPMLVME